MEADFRRVANIDAVEEKVDLAIPTSGNPFLNAPTNICIIRDSTPGSLTSFWTIAESWKHDINSKPSISYGQPCDIQKMIVTRIVQMKNDGRI